MFELFNTKAYTIINHIEQYIFIHPNIKKKGYQSQNNAKRRANIFATTLQIMPLSDPNNRTWSLTENVLSIKQWLNHYYLLLYIDEM
jgi:hypothetical protein